MGKGTSLFSGVSRFLGAVKNESGLSPAVAKLDALVPFTGGPDSFLTLEQLRPLPYPLCLGSLPSEHAPRYAPIFLVSSLTR